MRTSVVYTTVCALALLSPAIGHAQTAPATTPTAPPAATPKPSREASVPTTPVRNTSPSENGFISEDLWSEEGATAQCRDGTYFHGYATARTCSDHGGLQRWLRGPDRPTLR